jgi:hypothetical protein
MGDAMDVNLISRDMELNFSTKNDDNDEPDSKGMDRGNDSDGDEETKEDLPLTKGMSD